MSRGGRAPRPTAVLVSAWIRGLQNRLSHSSFSPEIAWSILMFADVIEEGDLGHFGRTEEMSLPTSSLTMRYKVLQNAHAATQRIVVPRAPAR